MTHPCLPHRFCSLKIVFTLLLASALSACGGSGGGDDVTDIFELTASSADIKTIRFDWPADADATHYKLFVNADGASGFTLLQDNLSEPGTSVELPVHLTDWINARYLLEAHNDRGKLTESAPIGISTLMLSSIAYAKASNTGENDDFGSAISLSADGNTLAVGANQESSNGDELDNSASNAGAVYVFSRSGSTWRQQAYIKASNTGVSDNFGSAVSLSADGNTLAVGAWDEDSNATDINGDGDNNLAVNAGAVYVFSRDGNSWSQQAYVKARDAEAGDSFGSAVSLSADGNTLAVGASYEASAAGAVYVFSRSGTVWSQQAYVKASNTEAGDLFGSVVSLSADGNTLAVGAWEDSNGDGDNNLASAAGAVYVFNRSGDSWNQRAYVKASNAGAGDFFGSAISLSADGNILAVGAHQEDGAMTDINNGGGIDNSASNAGAVYVFSRRDSSWSQQAYVKASNIGTGDLFGSAVSLSANGNILAVGARNEYSNATGINGDGDNNLAGNAGAVYVFSRGGTVWSQQSYVKASNTGVGDNFGSAVSLSADGNTLVVGALLEDSNAIGINGGQADDSAVDAGAVYLY